MLLAAVVRPALQNVEARRSDEVDEAVLLGQAEGPGAGKLVFQRLRLAQACEGIANRRFGQAIAQGTCTGVRAPGCLGRL